MRSFAFVDAVDEVTDLFAGDPREALRRLASEAVMRSYAVHTDATVECRNLRQLAAFVETLAERRGGAG